MSETPPPPTNQKPAAASDDATCSWSFTAGDAVHHVPSGEDWMLANDEENGQVSPSGWPPTLADAKDCRLLEPAEMMSRIQMLQEWAKKGLGWEHENDHRTRTARHQLSSLNAARPPARPNEHHPQDR